MSEPAGRRSQQALLVELDIAIVGGQPRIGDQIQPHGGGGAFEHDRGLCPGTPVLQRRTGHARGRTTEPCGDRRAEVVESRCDLDFLGRVREVGELQFDAVTWPFLARIVTLSGPNPMSSVTRRGRCEISVHPNCSAIVWASCIDQDQPSTCSSPARSAA